jgi:hypothetical protein
MFRLLRSRYAKWVSAMILSFSVAMLAFSVSGVGAMHAMAGSSDTKVAAAASGDAPKPPPCDQCGGDHEMSAAACSALCASSLAVLPSPGPLPVMSVMRIAGMPTVRSPVGHNDPPDPYPPRPAIPS